MRYLTLVTLCLPLGLWAQTTESVDISDSKVTQAKLEAWKRNSYELIPQKEPVYREPTQQSRAGIPKGYVSYPSPFRVSAGMGYGFGNGYGYGAPYNYNPYAYQNSYPAYSPYGYAFTNPAQFAITSGLNYLLDPETRRYWRGNKK